MNENENLSLFSDNKIWSAGWHSHEYPLNVTAKSKRHQKKQLNAFLTTNKNILDSITIARLK